MVFSGNYGDMFDFLQIRKGGMVMIYDTATFPFFGICQNQAGKTDGWESSQPE